MTDKNMEKPIKSFPSPCLSGYDSESCPDLHRDTIQGMTGSHTLIGLVEKTDFYSYFAATELAALPVRSAYQGESSIFTGYANSLTRRFRSRSNPILAKYPNIDSAAMGLPANWEREPLWQ